MQTKYAQHRRGFTAVTKRRWISVILGAALLVLVHLMFPITSKADRSSEKTDYELQERCGITSSRWAREHNEVIDYEARYNKKENRCIVYATLAPIVSKEGSSSYYMVYDPNSNKILAQYTVRSGEFEDTICIVDGKNISGVSVEKWKGMVKEFMGK